MTLDRLTRKLLILAGTLAVTAVASGLGTPAPAQACTQTCLQECRTWWTYCHSGGTYYEGCNFVRPCGGSLSACELQECYL